MKILFLVRHAKSSWNDPAIADFDRPLNARGVKDAGEMAVRLSKKTGTIDAFISSPAKRAKTTAEKFAGVYGNNAPVLLEEGLYLAAASFFEALISKTDNRFSAVAVFSHNPGITDYANTLTSQLQTDNIPTCGIFAVTAAIDDWSLFSAAKKELLLFDYPKLHS